MTAGSGTPKITIVLLNYKRPQNIPIILDAIHAQTIQANVFLWNNGTDNVNSPLIDYYKQSNENVGCMARWRLAQQAQTPYVMSLDDDICLNTDDALYRIVRSLEAQSNPNRIVGLIGSCFSNTLKYNIRKEYLCRYWNAQDNLVSSMVNTHQVNKNNEMTFVKRTFIEQDASVDMVKGRCMAFRRELLEGIELPDEREDDIFLNALFSAGKRNFHCVPKQLDNVFKELPEFGKGNWLSPGHNDSRNRALQSYFSN